MIEKCPDPKCGKYQPEEMIRCPHCGVLKPNKQIIIERYYMRNEDWKFVYGYHDEKKEN